MPTVKEYQELIANECPWCGGELIIKQGKFGEFVACGEWCGYTTSIPGRSSYTPQKATHQECPFNKCDGSGLIPFMKDGKVIPNAFLHCECKIQADNREYYIEPKLEDLDFPMSDSFRGWAYQHCGISDPGYTPYQLDIIHTSNARALEHPDRMQQLEAKFNYLRNKINELSKPKVEASMGITPL
jgi:hypothetical protein